MPRPKIIRTVQNEPHAEYYKPRGVPLRDLEEVSLAIEELEALRLADVKGLDQMDAATEMSVSRPTFARVLHAARAKVADALVNGKALRIEGGTFRIERRRFACLACGHRWEEPFGTGRPGECPACGSNDFHRESAGITGDDGEDSRGRGYGHGHGGPGFRGRGRGGS